MISCFHRTLLPIQRPGKTRCDVVNVWFRTFEQIDLTAGLGGRAKVCSPFGRSTLLGCRYPVDHNSSACTTLSNSVRSNATSHPKSHLARILRLLRRPRQKESAALFAPKMEIHPLSCGPPPPTPYSRNSRDYAGEFPGRNSSPSNGNSWPHSKRGLYTQSPNPLVGIHRKRVLGSGI
jgi:hypothetical protein